MYDYITGTVVEKGPMHCVLEVRGAVDAASASAPSGAIGYHVTISLESSDGLRVGESSRIFTHLQVRDVEHRLFGFLTREERSLFQLLLTVTGIGPSLAIKLLSGCAHHELRDVIQQGDLDRLKKVRGVGAKTGQRILVELQDTITTLAGAPAPAGSTGGATAVATSVDRQVLEDALLALLALGYNKSSAEKALARARKDGDTDTTEELVRLALQYL